MTLSNCLIVLYLAPECKSCYVSILYQVSNKTWDTPATFIFFYYFVTLQKYSVGSRDRIPIPFHWIRTIFTNVSYARKCIESVEIKVITFCDAINSWQNWKKRKIVKLIILKLAVKSIIYIFNIILLTWQYFINM